MMNNSKLKQKFTGYWLFNNVLYIVGDFSYSDFVKNQPNVEFFGYVFFKLTSLLKKHGQVKWLKNALRNGQQIACFI